MLAGTICAVTGPSYDLKPEKVSEWKRRMYAAGAGTGTELIRCYCRKDAMYRMNAVIGMLRQLEEEDPLLTVLIWKEATVGDYDVCLMGEVQIEILHELIMKERFGVDVTFGEGKYCI